MPDPPKTGAERLKLWIEIVQGTLTILGIFAAGMWFFAQRSDKPQIKLEHFATDRALSSARQMSLVAVEVRVTNVGKVKVHLDPGNLQIDQFNPVPGVTLLTGKKKLKELELEPGESDQALFEVYQLPDYIKTIQIHSDYDVPNTGRIWWKPWTWFRHEPLHWNLNSAYDVGGAEKSAPVRIGSTQ
jgi:hypothetical protein